jgi:acetylornithine deacetylase
MTRSESARWARAHRSATGADPQRAPIGATTDARYYLNQFGVPALCYGPHARNIHASDEAVELASIVTGAKALARFMAAFYAGEVIPA